MSTDALLRRFTYHPPTPESVPKFAHVRANGLALASVVMQHCPPCEERDEAIRKIEEAVMWANAGIARPTPPPFESARSPSRCEATSAQGNRCQLVAGHEGDHRHAYLLEPDTRSAQ